MSISTYISSGGLDKGFLFSLSTDIFFLLPVWLNFTVYRTEYRFFCVSFFARTARRASPLFVFAGKGIGGGRYVAKGKQFRHVFFPPP